MNKDRLEKEISRFLDAWMAVRKLIQSANFNRFQREGLSATQFMTLNVLPPDNGPGITLSELAKRMNLGLATLVKTVERLEARGLLIRDRNPADRRALRITVTDRGKELQNAASREFRVQIAELFRSMPRANRTGLVEGLEALVKASGTLAITDPKDGADPGKRSSPRSRRP